MKRTLTLDEWVEKHGDNLPDEIETHLDVYGVCEEDRKALLRLIFISIRQWTGWA
jgi:hypothetical protein